MFKGISLIQTHSRISEQKENQPLIVIERSNFHENKMYANLCSQLQEIEFDDQALIRHSTKNTIREFLRRWGVLALWLLFAGLTVYWIEKSTLLSAIGLLGTAITMTYALSIDTHPNKKICTTDLDKVQEVCRFNPAAQEYLAKRYQETGGIMQQDLNYLRIDEQLEKIAEHEKKLLLLRMVQVDTPASLAQSADLAKITIDTTKNLAWHTKRYKKVAFTWISACTALCLIAVGLIMVSSFILLNMALVLLIVFSLLVTLDEVFKRSPYAIRNNQVELSDYEKIALLYNARKENQDYIKSVLAENRPMLKMDWKNIKADKQLALIKKLKVEKFFHK